MIPRCLPLIAALASLVAPAFGADRLRLLFDDYYQKPRDDKLFQQGVARGDSTLRESTNFYLPTASAIPNGTFAFTQLIADRFNVEVSRGPVSADLLASANGYLLFCPVRAEDGSRAQIGPTEARVLESFVRGGGMLVLVGNSVSDPARPSFDLGALNLVAREFGVEFTARQTETISIPVPRDSARFAGVTDMIFGNGTTIQRTRADAAVEVLLESSNPEVAGPAVVLVRHGKGRVLLVGDAGVFGNAHAVRSDVSQAAVLRQMMEALLPDGPCPSYGWRPDQRFTVQVTEERIISGYPEFMRVYGLPRPEGVQSYSSAMRQIDREAAARKAAIPGGAHEFVSSVVPGSATFSLEIGASDGKAFAATVRDASAEWRLRLLANGRMIDPQVPGGSLAQWQQTWLTDLLIAPLKAFARPGDVWRVPVTEQLPQLQLRRDAATTPTEAEFEFVGTGEWRGTKCFVFTRRTHLDARQWQASDLVSRESAPQFNSTEIRLFGGGQVAVARYWISQDTRLPVHTELQLSASIWWNDARFPSHFVGSHDTKSYETWMTATFVATFGRTLAADFVPQDAPR